MVGSGFKEGEWGWEESAPQQVGVKICWLHECVIQTNCPLPVIQGTETGRDRKGRWGKWESQQQWWQESSLQTAVRLSFECSCQETDGVTPSEGTGWVRPTCRWDQKVTSNEKARETDPRQPFWGLTPGCQNTRKGGGWKGMAAGLTCDPCKGSHSEE